MKDSSLNPHIDIAGVKITFGEYDFETLAEIFRKSAEKDYKNLDLKNLDRSDICNISLEIVNIYIEGLIKIMRKFDLTNGKDKNTLFIVPFSNGIIKPIDFSKIPESIFKLYQKKFKRK